MNKFLPVAFVTTLLIGACRPADNTGADMMDVVDMAMPPLAMATTIRDLNSPQNTVKVGTRVKITGVVTSPIRWVSWRMMQQGIATIGFTSSRPTRHQRRLAMA